MANNNKLTFCTGVDTVTGADFLLETAGLKVLVDCGLIQGERVAMLQNHEPFAYEPSTIDVLLVTHAHLDHVGRIPKLVREGFKGVIYSTPETKSLAELILNDAVGILAMEAKQEGGAVLYTLEDVNAVFPLWKTVEYHKNFDIGTGVSVYMKDAGHILGSAMFEISFDGTKILFTGDVGNSPAPLLRDTESVGDVDYLVMETVYGDRNHEAREVRDKKLEEIINTALVRGGTLVIPAFSVDRTQVLLYELNNLVKNKRIPSIPVFVDSPLATKVTDIYKSSTNLFNDKAKVEMQSDDILSFPNLAFTISRDQSNHIDNVRGAKIILAGSGMSVGGRVISHEAHYLPDPTSTILLVGYQTTGSLGRQLADGAKKVRIHGDTIKVKATIETLYGYSAHKDSDHLLEFVTTATDRLKTAFMVMGEPKGAMHMAQRITDELGLKAVVPQKNVPYEL